MANVPILLLAVMKVSGKVLESKREAVEGKGSEVGQHLCSTDSVRTC
jgi:hypothetical protein